MVKIVTIYCIPKLDIKVILTIALAKLGVIVLSLPNILHQ